MVRRQIFPARTSWWRGHSVISLQLTLLVLCLSVIVWAQPAGTKPASTLDPDYISALMAADHFLQAWQSGDIENGMALLTEHAKKNVNRDDLDTFFSNGEASGYEIDRGKPLRHGRYEFPIVVVALNPRDKHLRRRFSSIIVVNTGNNGWAVDKLP